MVGDELRLRQAVGNLLANTRAHTPAGTRIVLSVSTREEMAVVEVADDVAAIAEAQSGSVEVESPPAGGAVFRILLPLG